MPCSTTQKHYKSHKPLTVCGSFIAAEQWLPSVCVGSNGFLCCMCVCIRVRIYKRNRLYVLLCDTSVCLWVIYPEPSVYKNIPVYKMLSLCFNSHFLILHFHTLSAPDAFSPPRTSVWCQERGGAWAEHAGGRTWRIKRWWYCFDINTKCIWMCL